MISKKRLLEIKAVVDKYGKEKAAKKLGISKTSVTRYCNIPENHEKYIKTEKRPNILIIDIETSPLVALIWSKRQKYISQENIIDDWFILSYAAKWLFEPGIMSGVVTHEEVIKKNDKRIVGEIWTLLEDADIVIAHNGDKFDIKRINSRFMYYNMNMPMPYITIDTLKVLRKEAYNTSNRLDDICKEYGLPCKIDNGGINLWYGCITGDRGSLDKMQEYNKNDVYILEELYVRIRKYIRNHPNMALYIDTDIPVCHNCGSGNLTWVGYYYTGVNKYSSFRCECGAIGRCRVTALSKKESRNVMQICAR